MLVKDWMSTNVITVDVADPMQHAINLTVEHRVTILPVLEDGKLAGVVTDRDLKRASPSTAAAMDIQQIIYHVSRVEVGAIMSRHPATIPLNHTIEEAAECLLSHKISGAPVVDEEGNVRGIITKSDLFKAMIALTGLSKRGVLFGLQLEDRPGSIKEVTDVMRDHGARLVSILTSYEKAPEGYRNVYVRTFSIDREQLDPIKEEILRRAKLLYIVDHRENKREIFSG